MKAMEKDRSRRYDTASSFASDVEAYLTDEQVRACPPSFAYRTKKLLRRHKARADSRHMFFSDANPVVGKWRGAIC